MNRDATELWQKLSNVPVDENGKIREVFQRFPIGTDRKEIHQWFEKVFDVSVVDLNHGKILK